MNISAFVNASPVFSIMETHSRIQKSLSELVGDDISFLQSMILIAIFFEDDRHASPTQLAKSLNASKSAVSHAISFLEYNKFVKREVNPQDARRFQIRLTDQGKKKVLKLVRHFDEKQKKIELLFSEAGTRKLISQIHQIRNLY